MIITLKTKDFSKELLNKCSMGENLHDIMAWATGREGWDDIESTGFEMYDGAIDYVMEHFDFAEAYLQMQNKLPTADGDTTTNVEWIESGLLYGAWQKLNDPKLFQHNVDGYKDAQEEIVHECLGGYAGRTGLNPDLAKELDESYDYTYDEGFREWLHGDHRNWDGIEGELSKALGRDVDVTVHMDTKTAHDIAKFDLEPENVRTEVEEWDGVETGKVPGEARIKAWLIDDISIMATRAYDKEMADRKKRREESNKTRAYQEERRKTQEETERQRLLAMKR